MSDLVKVRVEGPVRESETSYNVFVDLHLNEEGRCTGASRREWFPKSVCEIEKVEFMDLPIKYYLTAPKWLLDKKKVKYEEKK